MKCSQQFRAKRSRRSIRTPLLIAAVVGVATMLATLYFWK
jgi:hypothetical protein